MTKKEEDYITSMDQKYDEWLVSGKAEDEVIEIAKGKMENSAQSAIIMLKEKSGIDFISRVTSLSIEKIKQIQKDLEKDKV